MPRGEPIEVLVVDDSAVAREAYLALFRDDPGLEVTVACDAVAALRRIARQPPDVIVLDLGLPHLGGLEFLARLRHTQDIPVVICSALAHPGTELALQARDLGAVAVVRKPTFDGRVRHPGELAALRTTIRSAARGRPRGGRGSLTPDPASSLPHLPTAEGTGRVVALGASTGGVEAIRAILTTLPESTPPILVVQHMPAGFTTAFARGLAAVCRMDVREARTGDVVLPGRVLIAPGDRHMMLTRDAGVLHIRIHEGPHVLGHRPSVNVLFRSLRRAVGTDAIAILLSGMGDDGAEGLLELRQAGALTIAQDEPTSAVWGMPKAAIDLDAADRVLSLAAIRELILAACRRGRPPGIGASIQSETISS